MFPISAHNWMRPESLETTLERLKRLNYDAISIMGEPDSYPIKETRALLDKYGVRCWGSVSIMTTCRDLLHPDKYLRVGTIQYLKDCLDMVAGLGGEILSVVPSEVGKTKPLADPEAEWNWCVEGLKEVAEHADKTGIRIGIEPINRFETYFINRHDQALCLANEVDSSVGVCLDAFHTSMEENDQLEAIRAVGSRLVDFHISDSNRRPPGQGSLDWAALLATLNEIKYQGCISAEFAVPMDVTPLASRKGDAEMYESGPAGLSKFIRDHGSQIFTEEEYSQQFSDCLSHIRECEKAVA